MTYDPISCDLAWQEIVKRPDLGAPAKLAWRYIFVELLGGQPGEIALTPTDVGAAQGRTSKAGRECLCALAVATLLTIVQRKRDGTWLIRVVNPLELEGSQNAPGIAVGDPQRPIDFPDDSDTASEPVTMDGPKLFDPEAPQTTNHSAADTNPNTQVNHGENGTENAAAKREPKTPSPPINHKSEAISVPSTIGRRERSEFRKDYGLGATRRDEPANENAAGVGRIGDAMPGVLENILLKRADVQIDDARSISKRLAEIVDDPGTFPAIFDNIGTDVAMGKLPIDEVTRCLRGLEKKRGDKKDPLRSAGGYFVKRIKRVYSRRLLEWREATAPGKGGSA